MFAKSIRLRFQLWLAFLLLAVLGGFGFTAYQLYRTSELNQVDSELQKRLGALSMEIRGPRRPGGPREMHQREFGGPDELRRPPPPDGFGDGPPDHLRDGPPPDMERRGPPPFGGPFRNREIRLSLRAQGLFDEGDPNAFYFAVWAPDGSLIKKTTNAPASLIRPPNPGRDSGLQMMIREPYREAYSFTGIGDCILVGRSIAEYDTATRHFAWVLLGSGAAVLFIGLGGGWALTTRALRPIRDISATATEISNGNLSQRIDVSETDSELGQLAGLLNSTFARLDAAFAQQKQFTADAAHELRTPLAVLISETQMALTRPRSAEEYRETVEACLETAQRMRRLTHSLLELARFDAGQEQIRREPFDVAELASVCAESVEALGREREVRIVVDAQPAQAIGDSDRVTQVITNLLTNAIFYNKPGGEVRIATRSGDNGVVLTVADTGQGISEEALPHIFERFYRADASRTRGNGNSGLGLAICKAIIDAHGGTISAESKLGVGTTFTVTLPRG